MKQPKELPGTKTMIKIQAQIIKPIKAHSWKNLPKEFQKKSDGYSKKFQKRYWIKTNDISTKDKLAFVVRKYYGFGIFNLLFYSRWLKNKNYNPKFKCLIQRKKPCPYKDRCRIWKIHQKGWSCKYNPKYRANFTKRAKIEIIPTNLLGEKDYKYNWDKRSDRMYLFNRWFWEE